MSAQAFLDEIIFRFAQQADVEELVALFDGITESIQQVGGEWEAYVVDAQANKKVQVLTEIIASSSKVAIAEYKGEIIAAANVQIVKNIRHGWQRAHLEEVIVKEGYRDRGVGSNLLSFIKEYCEQSGIKAIKLLCGNQLVDSQNFYEKNGFLFTDKGYRFELE